MVNPTTLKNFDNSVITSGLTYSRRSFPHFTKIQFTLIQKAVNLSRKIIHFVKGNFAVDFKAKLRIVFELKRKKSYFSTFGQFFYPHKGVCALMVLKSCLFYQGLTTSRPIYAQFSNYSDKICNRDLSTLEAARTKRFNQLSPLFKSFISLRTPKVV